ncbi:hypothetical protein ACN47E_007609 [Coniothyrium glycines]
MTMNFYTTFVSSLLLTLVLITDHLVASASAHANVACSRLEFSYPHNTFLPGTSGYTYETQIPYWSSTTYSAPACVFVPRDTQQLSHAIKILTLTSSKFAVRGGGHMPIPSHNGIDESGILLSSSNLTTLSLSPDKTIVSVGAGNRWRDVYDHLRPSGLVAVGGRVGHVGVPGLLLGGGISFYSSQYGFASDNVVKYQCVLASGSVVEATATNSYSDLFWALKGGGNSFAIVTRFDLKTISSPLVHVGIAQYDQSQAAGYLNGVFSFGKFGAESDRKAAIVPTILTFPAANLTVYAAAKFYDSLTDNPRIFENFTAPKLAPVVDSYFLQSLSDYIATTDVLQPLGLRQEFRTVSSIVHVDAVRQIHNSFISGVNAKLSSVAKLQASITFQPVTKDFLIHSANIGGNPQGVDASKAPFFWMVENFTWTNATDDTIVHTAADQITVDIKRMLTDNGWDADYLYMNDAGKGQAVFQSYPAANLRKLKAIRAKYDPQKIYTKLMPGGWKVADT